MIHVCQVMREKTEHQLVLLYSLHREGKTNLQYVYYSTQALLIGNAQGSTLLEPLTIITFKAGKKITRSHPTLIAHLHTVDKIFLIFGFQLIHSI